MFAPIVLFLISLDGPLRHALELTFLFGGFLLLWRLWRFTLMPALNPNAPRELPY